MSGRLIVCPTPIGNLEDVTLRVLSALRDADVIACEDTRTTKVLLDRYGVSAERVRYDAHAERRVAPRLVERMRAGAVVALVSDAGMPLVSDPGLVLVQACMAAGLEVEVLPGPSAALAALVASGMEAATWRFVGFLPRKKGALEAVLRSPEVVVAFESPRRVASSLAVLAAVDPERPVAVCRELTKVYEEVVRGSASELAARYAEEGPRGEVVLVIGAAQVDEVAARARARGAAAAGRRGRGAAAAGGRRGGRAHRDERECAVSRADRHEVAHGLQQVTHRGRWAPSRPYGRRMAPRPHPVVLASLVLGCVFVIALVMPRGAAGADWRWPLRGPVVGAFHLSPRAPFARGQRRGIDVSAPPGAVVRAACAGRVSFAGPVPRRGLAVSVRCGALAATYLGLGRLAVRAGSRLAAGQGLGTLGPAGRLRLGARRAGDRRGYLDPLTLLADDRPAPPRLGPAPRARAPAPARPRRPAARPRRSRPRRRSRRAGCRGPPTRRWRSWPPRFPSAAWCGAAVAGAPRSRTEHGPPPTRRRRPADAL